MHEVDGFTHDQVQFDDIACVLIYYRPTEADFFTRLLKPSLAELGELNRELEQFADHLRLDQLQRHRMILTIEELVTNVITHGRSQDMGDISVTICRGVEGVLEVELLDDGIAFDPFAAQAEEADVSIVGRPLGGLGLRLVTEIVRDASYKKMRDRNMTTFSLPPGNAARDRPT